MSDRKRERRTQRRKEKQLDLFDWVMRQERNGWPEDTPCPGCGEDDCEGCE